MLRFLNHTPRSRYGAVLVLCLACVACGPQEQISTYEVQRTRQPQKPFDPGEITAGLDHLLAAMVPINEQVWFFKLVGKSAAVDRHREDFLNFLAQVAKGDSAEKPVTWTLPEGWKEGGPAEMRFATVVIPDAEGDLEITVSSLPMMGDWPDFLESNVERWLRQLGQGSLPRQTILNLTKEVTTAAGPAKIIELAGMMEAANPHSGMGGTAMMGGSGSGSPPPGHPAITPESADSKLTFKTPDGWQPGQVTSMRRAAFNITSGDLKGEVTVSTLLAAGGPQVSDVKANVSRWGGQVGLPPDTNWEQLIQPVKIDGLTGSQVKLVGPATDTSAQSMLAAMVVRDQEVWFIKLVGDAELVEQQAAAFQDFLKSMHLE
jgi:hypothetical protein